MSRHKSDEEKAAHSPPSFPQPYPLDEAMAGEFAPEPEQGTRAAAASSGDTAAGTASASEAAAARRGKEDGAESASSAEQAAAAWPGQDSPAATLLPPPARPSPQQPATAASSPAAAPGGRLHDQPPETVAERLRGLPPWQARFVLALMELGGVIGLACTRAGISRRTYERAMEGSGEFAAACAEAVDHSTDLVEAAVIRGASIGDLTPIYQGGLLVGYKRVRNTKDAELALTLRGRLKEEKVVKHTGSVEIVRNDQLPIVLAEVMARLFAARQGRLPDAGS